MLRLFLGTVLCGCLVSLAQAQSGNGGLEYETSEPEVESSEGFQPSFKPALTVTRAKGVIRVDGQLDEDAWRDVMPISNFSEVFPDEQG
ncbi:MAG: hypothetical protein OXH34_06720, partial [Bacteroidetes bacterium]|nr:hypothetical protein [Bacteroidota bacterium]